MAAKKKTRTGSKVRFVRANPKLTTSELIALGEKQGITVSAGYIYNIRSQLKGKPGKKRRPRIDQQIAEHFNGSRRARRGAPMPLVDVGERFVELLTDALQHTIAVIVREEIRKVLQGGLR